MYVDLIECLGRGLGVSHPQAWPCFKGLRFKGPRAILVRAHRNIA